MFDANRQYLNAMNRASVVMYTMIITSLLHLVWCYLLVFYWTFDVMGIALATLITFLLNFGFTTFYARHDKELRKSFFWFDKDSFKDLNEYLKIGIPSCFMLCLEWWSFEVLAFMAGYLSVEATAAHVIVINTHVVVIMLPLGAQVATIVTVGKSMGEGSSRKAAMYYRLTLIYSFLLDALVGFFIVAFRENLAHVFTTQEELIPMVKDAYIVMVLILLLHGLAMV
jgi:multidrug resistance protein, MATE family